MAPAKRAPITFVVSGASAPREMTRAAAAAVRPLPAGLRRGTVKQAVRVAAQRDGAADVRMTAQPGQDVVVIHIAGGPVLVLHPDNARDLMSAQSGSVRREGGARESGGGEIRIPARLQWAGLERSLPQPGARRGALGDVVLSAVEIVTGVGKDPAANFVASEVVRKVDAQVNAGVYRLSAGALTKLKGGASPLSQVPAAPDGKPLLVFVHGTFSETSGSFGKLWAQHPQLVESLFDHYEQQIYALDHPTLGVSPIDNALMLARACPENARIHLITHSRGGLVAEVLARVCAKPKLAAADFGFFKGDAYAKQRDALRALGDIVAKRKLRVERVVRVACPARGTLLASKRLDAYVSVFKWSLELAGVPVAPELVDFLGEVAQRRADPEVLPGLAAQIPDSPLVRWLHSVDDAIPGDLRVISGDIEGDSVTSWVKTLLADAFYWDDNDLVVQTRSMYGGAPRAAGATFLFDQGGKVSHFNYFGNARTAEACVNAACQDSPQGFRLVGPLSWSGTSSTGVRAAARAARDGTPASEKPAVFVLPGILGSNLKVKGTRIWLSWHLINGLARLEYKSGQPDGVEPDGAIGQSYDDLEVFLADTHEVIEFAYDWRRPMEEEAQRFAKAIEAALVARKTSGQPVRIVAHSMGGLIARTMQLERPDVWKRLMAHPDARMVMLGTPNGGSWAPMQVLSGDDTFGNALAAFGAPFHDHEARQLMASLPGFIQLQAALVDDARRLDQRATWQKLADDDLAAVQNFNAWHHNEIQLNVYRWGVPPQDAIDRAVALRKRLDAQLERDLDPFTAKMLLVAGKARFTPDGYDMRETGLEYLDAPEAGDGRVTIESARISGVRTWQIDCEHGNLPAYKDAFAAYLDLLTKGTTSLLSPLADTPSVRGKTVSAGVGRAFSRPSRMRPPSRPPESERDVLGREPVQPREPRTSIGTALKISVINGDLMFVRQPLLIGHYVSLRLTGTEGVVDRLLDGVMSKSLAAGLYPDVAAAHQIFVNARANRDDPTRLPRPQAAIVVGLGAEGKLTAAALVLAVRQAIVAWSQRLAEMGGAPAVFEIASTLIGSGGVGITAGQAARLISQGAREANAHLAQSGWPLVNHLVLVELYLDRASDVWRALQVQAAAAPAEYDVTEFVQPGPGALPRMLDSGYRGADYDLISAISDKDKDGDPCIAYTLDTKRARSEVRAQQTQSGLLQQLVSGASSDQSSDAQIGRTLFKLLVPLEMEPFLGGTTEMQLEVDRGTAGIPWELLDSDTPGSGDSRPWAIRARLLRKLRTDDFRAQVTDAGADASVLVIGEPACDPLPRLPGAREEALAIAKCLASPKALGAERVVALISPDDPTKLGPDARTILTALLGRDWRIVHIAGHGAPPLENGPEGRRDPRGVVLSDGTFLGPREIRNMRVVPELVFVNCCHLAARNAAQLLDDRPRFAAGVAEELIKIGVRCVIAAGWAVDDEAASTFATTFYAALLRGERFIDAVAQARQAAWEAGSNTWAAYQCYGDPDWRFRSGVSDAQRPTTSIADEFAGVAASKSLVLALESLAVKSKFQKAPPAQQQAKIRHLEALFAARWGDIGEVAEGFGRAWAETDDFPTAIKWYERALNANDGTASLKAVEQLGNLRAKNAWAMVRKAFFERVPPRETLSKGKNAKKTRGRASGTGGKSDRARKTGQDVAALKSARDEIAAALRLLERAADLQPTIERESLCGSAWKRLAMIEAAASNPRDEAAAIENMKRSYQRAEKIARDTRDDGLFYPALNRMAAELIVDAGARNWPGFDPVALEEIRANLAAKTRDDPDFWSVAALTELRFYLALAERKLTDELGTIVGELDDLHVRVGASSMWGSVLDQMGFVLPAYERRSTATEKNAVARLRKYLESIAVRPQ
ncbi:MAG TPA: CHAT domain-containing protein [Casimicrobiaceae bacterium]